ncbi:unnamed protein product [Angiostrongylus costaricensis]|uniref:CHK domain-containing protein n=1 Tax=Angiostrongylus costaricensis TaxID=334426 RepID=A0A0R3PAU4_ANGCS|nr:unnamed protein product [Angiostrongylus costaricensis]
MTIAFGAPYLVLLWPKPGKVLKQLESNSGGIPRIMTKALLWKMLVFSITPRGIKRLMLDRGCLDSIHQNAAITTRRQRTAVVQLHRDRCNYNFCSLQSGHVSYRVFFVQNNDEQEMELPEASKLAAFLNSKFFHEAVTENRLAIPCGRLEHSFRIEDDDLSYLVFVVIFQHGVQKHQLSEHELCQACDRLFSMLLLNNAIYVAEKIAIMHSINTATISTEFLRVIEENHENIQHYQKSIEPQLLEILREALMGGLSQYFSLPMEVMPRLMAVLESKDDSVEPSERVICHGNLTAEKCYFRKVRNGISSNRYQQVLVDISEWENVHFGDVAFDLSNLIISSAEPSTRRNKYMTKNAPDHDNFQIFRSYYYSRVDRRTTKFNLAHLKRLFRKHHREVVLLGIEPLLEVLSSDADNDVKIAHSYRWESALEDAFGFCTQDYVSDDEHCLFAN